MADKYLHALALPSDAQQKSRSRVRRDVELASALAGGTSSVESIALEPGEQLLSGQYRQLYAGMMAAEVEELFDGPDIGPVPLYDTTTQIREAGYYVLRNIDVNPVDPREDDLQSFEGVLRKAGTPRSHWRAVKTGITQIENDFGNAQTALVGIPATATKVRWFDEETRTTEAPTLVATENGEDGDVETYDARASSFTNPTLIYEVDLADESPVDPIVYDDRGNADKTDSGGIVQWQHVYRNDHVFEGKIVVDNGLLRLTIDEPNNSVTAEEWNDGTSSWDALALGSSTDADEWQILDFDLTYLDLGRIRAQTIWEDTGGETDDFHLEIQLPRGYDRAQIFWPQGESGPVPSGLNTKLDPIADDQDFSAQADQSIVPRSDVRK